MSLCKCMWSQHPNTPRQSGASSPSVGSGERSCRGRWTRGSTCGFECPSSCWWKDSGGQTFRHTCCKSCNGKKSQTWWFHSRNTYCLGANRFPKRSPPAIQSRTRAEGNQGPIQLTRWTKVCKWPADRDSSNRALSAFHLARWGSLWTLAANSSRLRQRQNWKWCQRSWSKGSAPSFE